MKIAIVTGSFLLGLVGSAAAQPGATPPLAPGSPPSGAPLAPGGPYGQPLYAAPPAPAPVAYGAPKSEGTALALSLGGTVLSWGLAVGLPFILSQNESDLDDDGTRGSALPALSTLGAIGTLVAPSFGHWYAGKFFTRGMGLRAGSLAVGMIGAVVALSECPISFGHDDSNEEDCDETAGTFILLGAVGLFVAGTVDDIWTAPRRVRRHNESLAGIAVAPIVTHQSTGLAVAGRF